MCFSLGVHMQKHSVCVILQELQENSWLSTKLFRLQLNLGSCVSLLCWLTTSNNNDDVALGKLQTTAHCECSLDKNSCVKSLCTPPDILFVLTMAIRHQNKDHSLTTSDTVTNIKLFQLWSWRFHSLWFLTVTWLICLMCCSLSTVSRWIISDIDGLTTRNLALPWC